MRAQATSAERELLVGVRQETDQLMAEADARLGAEREALEGEIGELAPSLAGAIADKLLGREVKS